jgi:signal transduction histidine kinase/CheY-like chemotaxis protein
LKQNGIPINPITLRFLDAKTEQAFCSHDSGRLVLQGRMAILTAVFTYAMLGILFDHWLFPVEVHRTVWAIRLTAIGVSLSVFTLTFHPLFERVNYLALTMVGLAGGMGLIGMMLFLPLEHFAYYYPALVTVTFFTYNFVGAPFIYALAVDVTLLVTYNVVLGWNHNVPGLMLAGQDFYIVTANLIGGGAGYMTEYQRRKLFVSEQNLHEQMRKVQAAQREALLANTAKSKFLAAASHDLRQPIHAQGLFLDVLSRTTLDVQQHEMLAKARVASDASCEMLDTLLDFSRIEAGVVKPFVQPFPLQPLLNKIEREFESQADARGLAYRSRETGLVLQSDPSLVELILRNLVSNAIRYTERGGLLVACRARGDHAVIEVWDTGIGIAPSHQQEIFREFHQLGNPERDRRKGLGLGLAIVEGLANTLGHRLSVSSMLGRGSVFRLAVPVAGAAARIDQPEQVQRIAPRLNVRVLVIDDDEAVRAGMFLLLRDWNCACEVAETIEEALALARVQPPDLVISDYRLRDQRSGMEAIVALRALLGKALPALLITGDTAPTRLREAYDSEIPLLHKPVSPGELYQKLVEVQEDIAR